MKLVLAMLLLSCHLLTDNCIAEESFIASLPELDRQLLFTQFLHQRKKNCSAVAKAGLFREDKRQRQIWAVQCANQAYYLLRLRTDGTGQADIETCTTECIKTVARKLRW